MGNRLPIVEELLEHAVRESRDQFVLVQLGARYGRYLGLGSRLLKQLKPELPAVFIGVEASPSGFAKLVSRMEKKGLLGSPNEFRQVAVSDTESSVSFVEAGHDGVGSHMVDDDSKSQPGPVTVVQSVTIEDLLANVEQVDFLEMDIQGAEYRAIPASADAIERKVKMICVRTHWPPREEQQLEQFFADLGWQKVLAVPNHSPIERNGKQVRLSDGVQCWVNTGLRPVCNMTITGPL